MSKRRDVLNHLRQLQEIGEIMRAMKNLATIESRKMARLMQSQNNLMDDIRRAAADFYAHHPGLRPAADILGGTLIVVGSERGFCGDFNEAMVRALESERGAGAAPERVISVGLKLADKVDERTETVTVLPGPSVAEEIHPVVVQLVTQLAATESTRPGSGLRVLHHTGDHDEIRCFPLLPFVVQDDSTAGPGSYPPMLNLTPDAFLADLTDEYVFGALFETFYASLAAENQQRMQHLQGAVDKLEEKSTELARKSRMLRQEEIVEEIEVILLSTGEEASLWHSPAQSTTG